MGKTNISSSDSHILRVLKALRSHTLSGISNGELVAALHESPANISRALSTLIEEGLALELKSGRFTLDIQLLQVVMTHSNKMACAQDRINEINQHVTSSNRLQGAVDGAHQITD